MSPFRPSSYSLRVFLFIIVQSVSIPSVHSSQCRAPYSEQLEQFSVGVLTIAEQTTLPNEYFKVKSVDACLLQQSSRQYLAYRVIILLRLFARIHGVALHILVVLPFLLPNVVEHSFLTYAVERRPQRTTAHASVVLESVEVTSPKIRFQFPLVFLVYSSLATKYLGKRSEFFHASDLKPLRHALCKIELVKYFDIFLQVLQFFLFSTKINKNSLLVNIFSAKKVRSISQRPQQSKPHRR